MASAYSVRVHGLVQGVGFRPFVYRLAQQNTLAGWVLNEGEGVNIHLEGADAALDAFLRDLERVPPPAAVITGLDVRSTSAEGLREFIIRDSRRGEALTSRIAPDLAVCADCLVELFDPHDRRFQYPYITCTNCGPRYSVVLGLPYDRPSTTMKDWPLDAACEAEYDDPGDRRFHAQPVACAACGPGYELFLDDDRRPVFSDAIPTAAGLLLQGQIVAMKGLGGYHLVCDAMNADAVFALRERKYRKEQPFALVTRDLETARRLVELSPEAEALLTSPARPVLLARAIVDLPGVAPANGDLGVMLPYTPVHHLLFAAGAPAVLVMTSGNRSSEPIAFRDDDARVRLTGIADAFLVGERPIARRVDDSVVRVSAAGPMILRRSRGYAPGVVAMLPATRPILAVGADLKNAITMVVGGQAIVSQHIGNLDHLDARHAFESAIDDLLSLYEIPRDELIIAHDAHPEYVSTLTAAQLPCAKTVAVQHHRAHIASVLAERREWDRTVIGVSLDGTGYGDDGTIWGGELFAGSLRAGFDRVGSLRQAWQIGGDAAARSPVQAAAGFLIDLEDVPDFEAAPFAFPAAFRRACAVGRKRVRRIATTSMGRLFDAVAAMVGFTRDVTFEGQAAMWLEHLARQSDDSGRYPFPFAGERLDYEPLLQAVAGDRLRGVSPPRIARRFQRGVAAGIGDAVATLCERARTEVVVCSGGVFQNDLLLTDLRAEIQHAGLALWTNHLVPPNDGGISLGQAALAAGALHA